MHLPDFRSLRNTPVIVESWRHSDDSQRTGTLEHTICSKCVTKDETMTIHCVVASDCETENRPFSTWKIQLTFTITQVFIMLSTTPQVHLLGASYILNWVNCAQLQY